MTTATATAALPKPLSARAFNKLGPKAQRQHIAKDVLDRLAVGQLLPHSSNGYVVFDPATDYYDKSQYGNCDARSLINQGLQCHVCALGGAACSIIAIENKIKTRQDGRVILGDTAEKASTLRFTARVKQILGARQTALIELAFEGSDIGLNKRLTAKEREVCERFCSRYTDAALRFRAIWEQVAQNGRFDPAK